MQGAYGLVRGGSSASNLLKPPRTFSNHIIAEIGRCVDLNCIFTGEATEERHLNLKKSSENYQAESKSSVSSVVG